MHDSIAQLWKGSDILRWNLAFQMNKILSIIFRYPRNKDVSLEREIKFFFLDNEKFFVQEIMKILFKLNCL